jgi:hypothetical protein
MIVWLIILGVVAAGVGLVVGIGMYERRVDEGVANTADWLEAKATIQDAAIERYIQYSWYSSFAFSYTVDTEYFSGRFFLKANQQQSEELVKTLLHQEFPVQYDPNNPSAWYIAQATIAGYEIIQKQSLYYLPETGLCRTGLYSGDGGNPIDLHLDT